jgi:hypothetical protein
MPDSSQLVALVEYWDLRNGNIYLKSGKMLFKPNEPPLSGAIPFHWINTPANRPLPLYGVSPLQEDTPPGLAGYFKLMQFA